MNQRLAKIRPYFKFEVAQLYRVSRPVFMDWAEEIKEDLEATGYIKGQHIFTLKQIEIIFNYFGHPPAISESEIHCSQRVLILPYTKSEMAAMYNISGKTLIAQIESIPDEIAKLKIMDGNNKYYFLRRIDKKLFKTREVELIFKHLGHPFLNPIESNNLKRRI